MNKVEKAIRENFPGVNNAALRRLLRDASQTADPRCAIASVASQVALTPLGKVGVAEVLKAIATPIEEE